MEKCVAIATGDPTEFYAICSFLVEISFIT